jgi:alkylation response protein AidB-like acyl-CoA dehydrogenase
MCDLGEDAEAASLQARIAAVDAAVLASDEAIQIHGGFGYTVEYHVERHYRDAKATEVIDGGNERCKSRLAALQFNS